MRYEVTFSLKDKTKLICITNGISKPQIVGTCIKFSRKLFRQRKFRLDREIPYSVEPWANRANAGSPGSHTYEVFMFTGNQGSHCRIQAAGVKSAYNQLMGENKAQEFPLTFLYDMSQQPQRRSSLRAARELSKDKKETGIILNKALEQAKEFPELGGYLSDILLLCNMIYDYCNGSYKEVPLGTIIGSTAAVLYFVSPVDLIPDCIPIAGQVDDVAVLVYVLKAVHKDLESYYNWKKASQAKA